MLTLSQLRELLPSQRTLLSNALRLPSGQCLFHGLDNYFGGNCRSGLATIIKWALDEMASLDSTRTEHTINRRLQLEWTQSEFDSFIDEMTPSHEIIYTHVVEHAHAKFVDLVVGPGPREATYSITITNPSYE